MVLNKSNRRKNKVLTEQQIENNRIEVINLLKSTRKEGIERVIAYLDKSGFFYARGSYKHHVYRGGLAEHALGVYRRCLAANDGCDTNSIIISALLHDLCKANSNYPSTIDYPGHGRRSVDILEGYLQFKLTHDEHVAILNHMHGAPYKGDLARLVHSADWQDAGGYPIACVGFLKGIAESFGL